MKQFATMSSLYKRRLKAAMDTVEAMYTEVKRAQSIVEECEAALEAQRLEAIRQEKEMYADLFRTVVRRKRFDDVKINLQLLKRATLEREKAVLAAEGELEKAQATLKQAQARHHECLVKCEKFNILIEAKKEEQQLANQAAEDAAMEEVVELMQRGKL